MKKYIIMTDRKKITKEKWVVLGIWNVVNSNYIYSKDDFDAFLLDKMFLFFAYTKFMYERN